MSLFSEFMLFCQICAKEFDASKDGYGKSNTCCSKDCWEEREWRYILHVMGKPYRPREVKHVS
jgi:hypothetical protein